MRAPRPSARPWLESQDLTPDQWATAAQALGDMAHREAQTRASLSGRSDWTVRKHTEAPTVRPKPGQSWLDEAVRQADRFVGLGRNAERETLEERVVRAVLRIATGRTN